MKLQQRLCFKIICNIKGNNLMNRFFVILLLIIGKAVYSQEGKYFGEEYACREIRPINHYYWIDLKKDKTFEFHIFNNDYRLRCKEINGTWEVIRDTLVLTKNKRKKYFYIISKDTIESPNKDVSFFDNDKEIYNKGIDDFGLGITKMIKIEKALLDKTGLTRDNIIKWSNKKSCN